MNKFIFDIDASELYPKRITNVTYEDGTSVTFIDGKLAESITETAKEFLKRIDKAVEEYCKNEKI